MEQLSEGMNSSPMRFFKALRINAVCTFLAAVLAIFVNRAAPANTAPSNKQLLAGWDFDTATQSSVPLATAIQSVRQYNANFGTNNGTVPKIFLDGTLGSSRWDTSGGEIWTGTGTLTNILPGSPTSGSNISLLLRGGTGLSSNNQTIVFELDMTKSRRLEISYALQATAGGFTSHRWHYWDDRAGVWRDVKDSDGNVSLPVPSSFSTITLDEIGGIGFNNRAKARVRLTVSGATAVGGTNLIDNIRFNATVAQ